MSVPSAEQRFSQGLAALADAQPLQAADHFLEAMHIEQRRGVDRPDMRFLSYYGLSLARAQRAQHAAVEACELAVRHDSTRPVLLLNLGRVHLMAGRLASALQCFERGLRLAPGHRSLRLELSRCDRRSRRALPFLDRANPPNRWLGTLRVRLEAWGRAPGSHPT